MKKEKELKQEAQNSGKSSIDVGFLRKCEHTTG